MKVIALVEEDKTHARHFELSALSVDPLSVCIRFATVVDLFKSLQKPLTQKPNFIFLSKEDFPGYLLMKYITGNVLPQSVTVTCFARSISPVEGRALLAEGVSYFYEIPVAQDAYGRLLSGIIHPRPDWEKKIE
jgi:hypothetical protein